MDLRLIPGAVPTPDGARRRRRAPRITAIGVGRSAAAQRVRDARRPRRAGRADQRHLLLPALQAVQSRVGWISTGALNYICQRLTVPPAEAFGVASFYALLSTSLSRPSWPTSATTSRAG